jgi:bifunctional non-homologous end joining protein LigD
MLATLAQPTPFDDPDWLFEVKWDGYRIESIVNDGSVRMYTRRGLDGATYFPGLLMPTTWISARQAIVDGEVVALDEDGAPDFALLQARAGQQRRDVTCPSSIRSSISSSSTASRMLDLAPLDARKVRLRGVLRDHPLVRYAGHIESDGRSLFASVQAGGSKGIMAKRRSSRYEPGRQSHAAIKIKNRPEQGFVVAGWEPAAWRTGTWARSCLASTTMRVASGSQGEVGSGLDARTRRDLIARMAAIARETSPFDPRLACLASIGSSPSSWSGSSSRSGPGTSSSVSRPTVASSPRGSAAFAASARPPDQRTIDRRRRHPDSTTKTTERATKSTHPAAKEATPAMPRSKPAADAPAQSATPAELAALDAMGAAGTWSIGGHEVALTNLDQLRGG